MEKLRNKYVTGVTALGLTLGTLFGSAGQADDVLANGVSEPAAEQMIEEDENSGFYAGGNLQIINSDADLKEYREINRVGSEITDSWKDVNPKSRTQIFPAIHVGKNIDHNEDNRLGVELVLGPKTTHRTSKERTYADADFGFGEENVEVSHSGTLEALRGSLKGVYEHDLNLEAINEIEDASLFVKAGPQIYKMDFDAETEYVIPARNTNVIDDASGSGTGIGYIIELGGKANVDDDLNVYASLFKSGGSINMDGRTRRRTGHGGRDERGLEGRTSMSDKGLIIGASYEW